MMGFDFADPERGLFGTCRPSGAAILFDHEDVLAASADARPELGDGGGDTTASLELDGVSVQLELSRIGGPLSLRGDRSGAEELAVCRVLGELRWGGDAQHLACLGIRTDAVSEAEPAEASLTRSIAIAFGDGGILALRAARPLDANEHGDEETTAAIANAAGEVTLVREALLSTQYDDAGRHLRATLELWPEQSEEPRPPLRAAGSIVCGTSLAVGERRLDVAFFRWSMGGRPGLGRYEILSAPAGD
jgi:hypothetical protein